MAQKSFTLDGKRYRLNALVPIWQIERMAAAWHVSTPDDDIRDIIARRINPQFTSRAFDNAPLPWTCAMVQQAMDYAVYCHRRNQRLWNYVATGG